MQWNFQWNTQQKILAGAGGGILVAIAAVFAVVDFFVLRGDVLVNEYASNLMDGHSYTIEAQTGGEDWLIEVDTRKKAAVHMALLDPDGEVVAERKPHRLGREGSRYLRTEIPAAGVYTVKVKADMAALTTTFTTSGRVRVFQNDRRLGPRLRWEF